MTKTATDSSDGFTIRLDYPIQPRPRYGHGRPPHPVLTRILDQRRAHYAQVLRGFVSLAEPLSRIPITADPADPNTPHWNNTWFEGIDALSVYAFLALTKPARYFEVGSGNSTKFARRAIRDHGLRTRITSIDPYPRTEINTICDKIVRQPLENVDVAVFDELQSGDVLFVDNSHRVFTNSDVTVVFLDVMPRLKPGVLLGIHDIMLPNDYPPEWMPRFYSEQYMLAAHLLAEGTKTETELPCSFVGGCAELNGILDPLWAKVPGAQRYGSAFWMRMR
jgi:hypothetical protein